MINWPRKYGQNFDYEKKPPKSFQPKDDDDDLSEYYRVTKQKSSEQDNENAGDLDEYYRATKQNNQPDIDFPDRSNLERFERSVQLALGKGLAAAWSLPHSIAQLGGEVKKTLPEWKVGIPSIGNSREREKRPKLKAPDWFKNIFPSYGEALGKINSNVPLPEPETDIEEAAGNFGEFVGGGLPFAIASGGGSLVPLLAGSAASSIAGQSVKKAGAPDWLQMILGGIADIATQGSIALSRRFRPGFRNGRIESNRPEVTEFLRAARDLNVEPIYNAGDTSRAAKGIQKWASSAPGGYEIAEQAYRRRSGQIARAYENTLDQVSYHTFDNPHVAGNALEEAATRGTQQAEHQKRQLYQAVEATIPENEAVRVRPGQGIDATNFGNSLNEAAETLRRMVFESPQGSAIRNRAEVALQRLENLSQRNTPPAPRRQLLDQHGNPIPHQEPPLELRAGVRELEASQIALRDVINFDKPGGADKLLRGVDRAISNTLADYGRTNPAYAQAKHAATQYFRNEIVPIRENIIRSIVNGETPELALNKMNTVTGIRRVHQALQHIPDGNRIFNGLRRFQLHRKIGTSIIDPATGLMRPEPMSKLLTKESRHVIEELAGRNAYHRIAQLQHLGAGFERGFNTLKNPSQSANVILGLSALMLPISFSGTALYQASQGDLAGAAKSGASAGAAYFAPRIIARMAYNPHFAENMMRASRAGQRGDASAFAKYLSKISEMLEEGKED